MYVINFCSFHGVRITVLTLVLGASMAVTAAHAQLFNVDFNGGQFGSGGSNNAGATQTGAAVIGSAGDTWNGFSSGDAPATGGGMLLAADGSASGVTLAYSVDGGYSPFGSGGNQQGDGFGDPNNGTPNGPYAPLMTDWFASYSTTNASTVTLSGLAANTAFNLYVYSESSSDTANRAVTFSVTGSPVTLTLNPARALGTFTSPADDPTNNNYGVLNAVSDSSGNLTISFLQASTGEADFDGFQLQQAVPEPSTWAAMLGGIALLGLILRHRSRHA